MSEMLKTIQKLLFMGGSVVGAAFVPYYRQILPGKHSEEIVNYQGKRLCCLCYLWYLLVLHFQSISIVFRLFYNKNVNIGDKIYYTQFKRVNMGDLIIETLELFERLGGPHAFINIKYMIPTYESVLNQKA